MQYMTDTHLLHVTSFKPHVSRAALDGTHTPAWFDPCTTAHTVPVTGGGRKAHMPCDWQHFTATCCCQKAVSAAATGSAQAALQRLQRGLHIALLAKPPGTRAGLIKPAYCLLTERPRCLKMCQVLKRQQQLYILILQAAAIDFSLVVF